MIGGKGCGSRGGGGVRVVRPAYRESSDSSGRGELGRGGRRGDRVMKIFTKGI
jgi:hypothetical protein